MSRRDGNAEVYVVNPAGGGERNLTRSPTQDLFPVWSPDGTWIAYLSGGRPRSAFSLWIMKADGTEKRRLQPAPRQANSFCWSPDSTMIAMGQGVVTIAGNKMKVLSTMRMYHPAWSPDGKKIAFKSRQAATDRRARQLALYVIDAKGGEPKKVSDSVKSECKLAWSPDSTRIAFMSGNYGRVSDIYAVNADGTGEKNLTKSSFNDRAPSWSAEGNTIVFESFREDTCDIYAMPAGGGPARRITSTPAWNRFPRLSPDGKRLAFKSSKSGDAETAEICIVNLDGTGYKKLTENDAFDGAPEW
jgi:TolB protein